MSFDAARSMAAESGADVVMMNDSADPPVVRLIQFSKYKFELERAAKQKQKSSKRCAPRARRECRGEGSALACLGVCTGARVAAAPLPPAHSC